MKLGTFVALGLVAGLALPAYADVLGKVTFTHAGQNCYWAKFDGVQGNYGTFVGPSQQGTAAAPVSHGAIAGDLGKARDSGKQVAAVITGRSVNCGAAEGGVVHEISGVEMLGQ